MKELPLWPFLAFPDHHRISKLHGINERLGNKSTPRNQRNHKVTGNWAFVATVQNCPIRGTGSQFPLFIRGTGSQFPLFIEWKPVGWQALSRGVARLADWLCAWPRPRHCRTGPLSWKHARVA